MSREHRRVGLEYREGPGGNPGVLRGFLARWGDVANMPGFRERFASGALRAASRVTANVGHDNARSLAATDGGGLELRSTAEGVEVTLTLPDTSEGRDVATLAKRGVLSGFSVEMAVKRDSWVGGLRTIREAVFDRLAVVDTPAYPASTFAEIRQAAGAPKGRRRVAV